MSDDPRMITLRYLDQADEEIAADQEFEVQEGATAQVLISGFYGSQGYMVGPQDTLLIVRMLGFVTDSGEAPVVEHQGVKDSTTAKQHDPNAPEPEPQNSKAEHPAAKK